MRLFPCSLKYAYSLVRALDCAHSRARLLRPSLASETGNELNEFLSERGKKSESAENYRSPIALSPRNVLSSRTKGNSDVCKRHSLVPSLIRSHRSFARSNCSHRSLVVRSRERGKFDLTKTREITKTIDTDNNNYITTNSDNDRSQ